MRLFSALSAAICAAVLTLPSTAAAQDAGYTYEEDPFADERLCYRPAPPDRRDYEDFSEYYDEREKYYRQSSIYIGCIDQWIEDSRRTYLEMYRMEAQTYLDERNEILDEMRAVGKSD